MTQSDAVLDALERDISKVVSPVAAFRDLSRLVLFLKAGGFSWDPAKEDWYVGPWRLRHSVLEDGRALLWPTA
jgi:hypothetical protein